MAVPQRRPQPAPGSEKAVPKRAAEGRGRRSKKVQRRRFALLVVVPVVLMLGSVYLHTVAADLGYRVEALRQERAGLLVEKERLEIEVSKLSAPDRIRPLARRDLGMKAPGAGNIEIYEVEDGKRDGERKIQEGSR